MDTKIVAKYFGGKDCAIEKIGTYRQQWDYWVKKGIPRIWQHRIMYLTDGKLKPNK